MLRLKKNFVKWIQEGSLTIPNALLNNYKQLNLNEEELVLLLHVLSFLNKGNNFPTPNELSSKMTISLTHCTEILHKLIQKGFIEIQDGFLDSGIRFEKYSIAPLWEKLADHYLLSKKHTDKEEQNKKEVELYTVFEQEFGRPLSSFEIESLSMWIDDDRHDPLIIKEALREAVISGKLNFRYIDRILFEWKKNGIQTIEQAKTHGRKIRQHQSHAPRIKKEPPASNDKNIPFYNWLEQ